MHTFIRRLAWLAILLCPWLLSAAGQAEHVVLIVWDGMRPDFITPEHTPALYQLAQSGVRFQKHHPVYCSSTEVNGTALATGAYPEHSGIIANSDYWPEISPLQPVAMQQLNVVRRGDQLTGGQYLLRPTLAEILQAAGKSTVIAGTKSVALLHDRRERPERGPVPVTLFEGMTLPASASASITNFLGTFPAAMPASSPLPNEPRDEWTTHAVIGPLWSNGVPAFTLLWLSEPDASQHASGPGSPKALAALESSDRRLAAVLVELEKRGVRSRTDVFVVSDHGFSTVETAVDVCTSLRDAGFSAAREFSSTTKTGDILVNGQGGSVLFHIAGHDPATARKLVDFLQQQNYAGVVFTRKPMEGTFTLEQALIASPHPPDVVLSLRWSADKSKLGVPGVFASDGGRKPGEGNHASLSRFDMHNTLVAAGPDLKKGFNDTLPTGNTDLAPTILWLLGVKAVEPMDGRVLSEALTAEAPAAGQPTTYRIETWRPYDTVVWRQYLQISQVDQTIYLDEGNGAQTPK